jgi:predicted GIY-YIG superfamily endonuclease
VIYALELEHGKWFVGKTNNLSWRLETHQRGAPPWVDLHPLVKVREIIKKGDLNQITLDYMKKE